LRLLDIDGEVAGGAQGPHAQFSPGHEPFAGDGPLRLVEPHGDSVSHAARAGDAKSQARPTSPVTIPCSKCGRSLRVDPNVSRARVTCPYCSGSVVLTTSQRRAGGGAGGSIARQASAPSPTSSCAQRGQGAPPSAGAGRGAGSLLNETWLGSVDEEKPAAPAPLQMGSCSYDRRERAIDEPTSAIVERIPEPPGNDPAGVFGKSLKRRSSDGERPRGAPDG